jgi:hypothetical protein
MKQLGQDSNENVKTEVDEKEKEKLLQDEDLKNLIESEQKEDFE